MESCDACFKSVQHEGEAKGTFEEIGSVQTYIASPPEGTKEKGIILFYSDVFAVTYINNQLIMDYFASQGAPSLLQLEVQMLTRLLHDIPTR